jgi:hypothetical protein
MNIALQEIKKVVTEVGENNIVHIITDNGSNYKKPCRYVTNEYHHIAWQPCLPHTINLMLKIIGDFRDHESVIDSAELILRWLYNYGRLHTMMKMAIGGNLVRWNITRFGMNYLFLESFLRRKDRFMQWMATPELQKSGYLDSNAGRYTHVCLSSLTWWDNLKRIVDSVQPLYAFLRFADQERIPNFNDVLFRYHILRQEYDALFHDDRTSFNQYMKIVNKRMHDITNDTYTNAGKMN